MQAGKRQNDVASLTNAKDTGKETPPCLPCLYCLYKFPLILHRGSVQAGAIISSSNTHLF